jgi:hypothetical protein
MAGYDPEQQFLSGTEWKLLLQEQDNRNSFYHPNPETRISDINKDLPKALEYYKAAGGKYN